MWIRLICRPKLMLSSSLGNCISRRQQRKAIPRWRRRRRDVRQITFKEKHESSLTSSQESTLGGRRSRSWYRTAVFVIPTHLFGSPDMVQSSIHFLGQRFAECQTHSVKMYHLMVQSTCLLIGWNWKIQRNH